MGGTLPALALSHTGSNPSQPLQKLVGVQGTQISGVPGRARVLEKIFHSREGGTGSQLGCQGPPLLPPT